MSAAPEPAGHEPLVLVRRAPIRVLIADAQPVERAGFAAMLESVPGVVVTGAATALHDAIARARELSPDVALVDLDLPGTSGVELARRLGETGTPVVALTASDDDETLFGALRAGARAVVLKSAEAGDLLHAVRAVAAGEAMLSPNATRRLIRRFVAQPYPQDPTADELRTLTTREREVIALVALGLRNGEIAARLVISPVTVKTHISRALRKLGARDRSQLIVIAYQVGLARPGERPAPRPLLVHPA